MKIVFTCMLVLLSAGWSRADNFRKLCEVNSCWKQHADAAVGAPEEGSPRSERDWIAFHLRMVEAALRQNCPASIGATQHANRLRCLDLLAAYTTARCFPVNDYCDYRTPVFIDRHDNFCAVGYLLKATGHELLARKISAWNNFAYVREIHFQELTAWASEFGFTTDELAWIQPGYPPAGRIYPIGGGVNGPVTALFPDNDEGKLYVGGNFTLANDTLPARNIVWLSSADSGVYEWHQMPGLDSTVTAIAKYKGKIFAGGKSVYRWDDSLWTLAGCLDGSVRDLAIVGGVLYAAGRFDICGAPSGANFARWTDSSWEAIPGLNGRVNTLEVVDSSVVLGGLFSFANVPMNAIAWAPKIGFWPYANGILNEVNDFEFWHDTLYAACNRTSATDTVNLMMRLLHDRWEDIGFYTGILLGTHPFNGSYSINTLCAEPKQLNFGGSFLFDGTTTWLKNSNSLTDIFPTGYWYAPFSVDSAINKMVIFQNDLIVGGNFQDAYGSPGLHHIGRRPTYSQLPSGVENFPASRHAACHPNPVRSGSELIIEHDLQGGRYCLTDMNGCLLMEGKLKAQVPQKLQLPGLAPGIYFLQLRDAAGGSTALRVAVY